MLIRNIKIVALFVTFAAYLFVPWQMISGNEKVLREGKVFSFKPRPVDPGDIFRGRYVRLGFWEDEVKFPYADSLLSRGQQVYVTLDTDAEGYAILGELVTEPPSYTSDYFETTVERLYDDEVRIDLPFEKYYMNENYAQEAEDRARELMRDRDTVRVRLDIRVMDGKTVIEELYFDDQPVMEFLREE